MADLQELKAKIIALSQQYKQIKLGADAQNKKNSNKKNPGLEKNLADLNEKLADFEKNYGAYIKAEVYDAAKHEKATVELNAIIDSVDAVVIDDAFYKQLPLDSPIIEGFEGLQSRTNLLKTTLVRFSKKPVDNKLERLAGLEKNLADLNQKLANVEKNYKPYIDAKIYDEVQHIKPTKELESITESINRIVEKDASYQELKADSPADAALIKGFKDLQSRVQFLTAALGEFSKNPVESQTQKQTFHLGIMGSQFLKSKFKNVDDYIDNLTLDFESNGTMDAAAFQKKYAKWGEEENNKPDFQCVVVFEIHKTGTLLKIVPSKSPNAKAPDGPGGLALGSITWGDVSKTPTKTTVDVLINRTATTQVDLTANLESIVGDMDELLKVKTDALDYKKTDDGQLLKTDRATHIDDDALANVELVGEFDPDTNRQLYKERKYTDAQLREEKKKLGVDKAVLGIQMFKKLVKRVPVLEANHNINFAINLEAKKIEELIFCPESLLGRIGAMEYKPLLHIGRTQKYIIKAGIKETAQKIWDFIKK
jgi:hypothetical protein